MILLFESVKSLYLFFLNINNNVKDFHTNESVSLVFIIESLHKWLIYLLICLWRERLIESKKEIWTL